MAAAMQCEAGGGGKRLTGGIEPPVGGVYATGERLGQARSRAEMTENRLRAHEIPDPAPAGKTPAGEVRRAIDRVRRGALVRLEGPGQVVIAAAAETLTEGSLAALR